MKTLVTGGSGFIGSHLVDSLIKRDNQVKYWTKKSQNSDFSKKATFLCGDITRKEDVATAAADVEIITYLAGLLGTHELIEQAYEAVRVNIGGCIRLLDYCRENWNETRGYIQAESLAESVYYCEKSCGRFMLIFVQNLILSYCRKMV